MIYRTIVLSLSILFFMSCEHTFLQKSLCENNLKDIKGFAGNYELDLGEGQVLPLSFVRKRRGVYHLGGNSEPMVFKSCIINGKNVVETISETENNENVYLLLEVNRLRSQLEMKSILLDEAKLDASNIQYQYETAEVLGEMLSVMLVDNKRVKNSKLISLVTNTSTREPFYLLLDKK